MNKSLLFYCTLLLCILFFTQCFNDQYDRANCVPVTTQLNFSYNGDGDSDIFSQKINSVNLFVFDESENYLFTEVLNTASLRNNPNVQLNLADGRYNIVAVGNANENSEFTDLNTGRLDSIFIAHPMHIEQERRVATTMDSLYISRHAIDVSAGSFRQEDMLFESSHFDVVIEIEGLAESRSNVEFPLRVAVLNLRSAINFENTSKDDYQVRYYPKLNYTLGSSKIELHFQILRHEINDPLQIAIINQQGSVDYIIDYSDFISANNIDVTKQEVEIPILVKYSPSGIVVTVPDWATENVDPEFE